MALRIIDHLEVIYVDHEKESFIFSSIKVSTLANERLPVHKAR